MWFGMLKNKDWEYKRINSRHNLEVYLAYKHENWIKYYARKRTLAIDIVNKIIEQMKVNKEKAYKDIAASGSHPDRPHSDEDFYHWATKEYSNETKFQKDFKQAEKDLYKKQTVEPEKPWNIPTRETKRGKWRDVLSPEEKKVEGIQEVKDKLESLKVKRTNLPPTKRGRKAQRKIDKEIERLQKILFIELKGDKARLRKAIQWVIKQEIPTTINYNEEHFESISEDDAKFIIKDIFKTGIDSDAYSGLGAFHIMINLKGKDILKIEIIDPIVHLEPAKISELEYIVEKFKEMIR